MNRGTSYWLLPTALATYATLLVVQSNAGDSRWWLLAVPVAVFLGLRRAERLHLAGLLVGPPGATRAVVFGTGLLIVSRFGPGDAWATLSMTGIGLAASAAGAFVAIARAEGPPGLVSGHPAAGSLDGLYVSTALWAMPLTLTFARSLFPARFALTPSSLGVGFLFASLATLLLLLAALGRVLLLRGLELEVADRARSALSLGVASVLCVSAATVVDLGAPEDYVPLAVSAMAALSYLAFAVRSPLRVTRGVRGLLVLLLAAAPIALVGAFFALRFPERAVTITLVSAGLAAFAGVSTSLLARPRGPREHNWVPALEAATESALHPDPASALRNVLLALGALDSRGSSRPELHVANPPLLQTVDVAGYLSERRAEFAYGIFDLAVHEPEATLRLETLRFAQVRRPKLQDAVRWFEARHMKAAVALVDEAGPLGLLVCPAGMRKKNLSFEEVRLLGLLGRRLAGLLAQSSAVRRAQERELSARDRADASEAATERLERELADHEEARTESAEELAARLRRVGKSPAVMTCLQALERSRSEPLVLVVPPGVDEKGFVAHHHLTRSGARSGPLVFFDALDAAVFPGPPENKRRDFERRLEQAGDGTFVLRNAGSLPAEYGLDARLRAGAARPHLVLTFGPAAPLPAWLPPSAEHPLRLPTLAERPEDLLALVLDELTRLGLALRGSPLGLGRSARMALVEREFSGNEEELRNLLFQAACRSPKDTLDYEDLFGVRGTEDDEEPARSPARSRARVPPRAYAADLTKPRRPAR